MQWVLHRVVALSGAAEATEEDLDSDDESSFDYEGEWEGWPVRWFKAVLAPNRYVQTVYWLWKVKAYTNA